MEVGLIFEVVRLGVRPLHRENAEEPFYKKGRNGVEKVLVDFGIKKPLRVERLNISAGHLDNLRMINEFQLQLSQYFAVC